MAILSLSFYGCMSVITVTSTCVSYHRRQLREWHPFRGPIPVTALSTRNRIQQRRHMRGWRPPWYTMVLKWRQLGPKARRYEDGDPWNSPQHKKQHTKGAEKQYSQPSFTPCSSRWPVVQRSEQFRLKLRLGLKAKMRANLFILCKPCSLVIPKQ